MALEKRKLGKTGEEVTLIGLGGEGILRTFGYDRQAVELINHAIDLGINYFESARAYSGSEQYYGLALRDRRKGFFHGWMIAFAPQLLPWTLKQRP